MAASQRASATAHLVFRWKFSDGAWLERRALLEAIEQDCRPQIEELRRVVQETFKPMRDPRHEHDEGPDGRYWWEPTAERILHEMTGRSVEPGRSPDALVEYLGKEPSGHGVRGVMDLLRGWALRAAHFEENNSECAKRIEGWCVAHQVDFWWVRLILQATATAADGRLPHPVVWSLPRSDRELAPNESDLHVALPIEQVLRNAPSLAPFDPQRESLSDYLERARNHAAEIEQSFAARTGAAPPPASRVRGLTTEQRHRAFALYRVRRLSADQTATELGVEIEDSAIRHAVKALERRVN